MADVTLTNVNNHHTVDVRVGDHVNINLAENATTGYQWEILSYPDTMLEFVGVERGAAAGDAFGAGGQTVFRFEAKAQGEAPVVLKLWRGHENDASVFKFSATLSIQP